MSFRNLDALGMIVGLRFQGQGRYKTRVGSAFTIMVVIVLVTTLAYFLNIYFSGTDFSEVISTIKYWDSQTIEMTQTFQMGVMAKVDGQIINNFGIWELQAHYIEYSLKNKTIYELPLNISTCSLEKWENVKYQFDLLELQSAQCIDSSGLVLKGNYNTEEFSYIILKYDYKIDVSNSSTNEIYSQYMNSNKPVLSFFYPEGSFEVNGYNASITYFINSINVNLTWMDTSYVDIHLSSDELWKNNDRVFFSELLMEPFYAVGRFTQSSFVRPAGEANTVSIKLMSSNTKSITTINYLSLTVIISRVGGVVQSLLIIIMFINGLLTDWLYDLEHINILSEKLFSDYQNYKHAIEQEGKVIQILRSAEPTLLDERRKIQPSSKSVDRQSNEIGLLQQQIKTVNIPVKIEEIRNLNEFHDSSKDSLKSNEIIIINEASKLNSKALKSSLISNARQKKSSSQLKDMREIIVSVEHYNRMKFTLLSLLCFKSSNTISNRCLSKRKKVVYEFIKGFLDKTFEVSNTHKSFLNIQLIKFLLFNESQLALFENVSIKNMQSVLEVVDKSKTKTSAEIGCLASAGKNFDSELSKKLSALYLN